MYKRTVSKSEADPVYDVKRCYSKVPIEYLDNFKTLTSQQSFKMLRLRKQPQQLHVGLGTRVWRTQLNMDAAKTQTYKVIYFCCLTLMLFLHIYESTCKRIAYLVSLRKPRQRHSIESSRSCSTARSPHWRSCSVTAT